MEEREKRETEKICFRWLAGSIYNWFCSSNILGLVWFDLILFLVCIQGQLDHKDSWGVLTLAAVHPANRWEVQWWPTIAGRQEVSNRDRLTSQPAVDRPAINCRPSADLQVYNNTHLFIRVCLVWASNCVVVVMSLVRVDSVKKSKKKLAGEILNHPSIPFISLGFFLSLSVCVCVCYWSSGGPVTHTHTEGTIKRMSDVG